MRRSWVVQLTQTRDSEGLDLNAGPGTSGGRGPGKGSLGFPAGPAARDPTRDRRLKMLDVSSGSAGHIWDLTVQELRRATRFADMAA